MHGLFPTGKLWFSELDLLVGHLSPSLSHYLFVSSLSVSLLCLCLSVSLSLSVSLCVSVCVCVCVCQ